jgi:hypothetical protein
MSWGDELEDIVVSEENRVLNIPSKHRANLSRKIREHVENYPHPNFGIDKKPSAEHQFV